MTMPLRKPRRRWRTLGAGIVLLLMASHLALGIITDRRLRKTVARLEQKYGSLDPATMAPPAVPDIENRVRLIRAAQQAMALTREDMQRIAAGQRTDDRDPLRQQSAALRNILDSNRAAFDLLAEASKLERSNWKVDYAQGVNAKSPQIGGQNGLLRLSDMIEVRARMEVEAGDTAAAAQTLKLGFAMADSFSGEKMFMLSFWRELIARNMIRPLREMLVIGDPSSPQLVSLQRVVEGSAAGAPFWQGLECEMKSIHALFIELEAGDWGRAPFYIDESFVQNPVTLWLCLPALRDDHAYALDLWDRIIDATKAAYGTPWGKPVPLDLPHPPRWYQVVSKEEIPWELSDLERFRRRRITRTSLAATALALRRYRLDHGSYPDELGALVPSYLAKIPIDAFTLKPPVYRRAGAGFQLWSEAEKKAYKSGGLDPILRWEVPR